MSFMNLPPGGNSKETSISRQAHQDRKNETSSVNRRTKAEAAADDNFQRKHPPTQPEARERDRATLEGQESSHNKNNDHVNKTKKKSPLEAKATQPLASNLPRQRPTAAIPRKINRGGTGGDSLRKIHKRRVVVLNGVLTPQRNWEDETQGTVRRSVIKGTWQFSDQSNAEVDPRNTFQLVSKTESTSSSGEPQSGFYSGHFGLVYEHVTPKGKQSLRVKKIEENSVKLEFRKLSDFYGLQGFGSNSLAGDFSLNGKAKPGDRVEGSYTIQMRKTYLSEYKAPPDRNRTVAGSSSSSASSASIVRSMPTTSGTCSTSLKESNPPSNRAQSEQRSSEESQFSDVGRTRKDSHSDEFEANNYSPGRQPERQGIPSRGKNLTALERQRAARKASDTDESEANNNYSQKEVPGRRPERQDSPSRGKKLKTLVSQKMPRLVSQSQTLTTNGVDRVNGKGMWHAWTRSFDTPLLALLDLFDNAVDASWTLLPEPQEHRSLYPVKPKIRVDLDHIGRNGVVIRNASKFIPSLQQVLQVYKSSKAGEGDNSIGENGIGVKHACASLSGLSFVFTKTTNPSDKTCTLSMGILMQDLQRDDGIVLPSIAFPLSDESRNGNLDEVEEKLETYCLNNPDTWGKAVKEYGEDDFGEGIDRCLQHMDFLRRKRDWRDSDNVFAVVLTNLKHAAFDNEEENEGNQSDIIAVGGNNSDGLPTAPTLHTVQRGGETDVDEDEQRSLSLLKTLRQKLPHLYLHLHDLDIWVEGKPIESIFWESRLAELTRFELQLPQTEPWQAKKPANSVNSVFDITKPEETVRFFCGFDPYRCQNKFGKKSNNSSASSDSDEDAAMGFVPDGSAIGGGISIQQNNSAMKIFLYSRQSGRLIKVQNDPRNEIGLPAGSTDFCQGMTVIVDDYNGTLPLNPTKQDTAYGHSKHGQTHAANLKEWTAAITHFYWQYHFERLGSSKVAVTEAVSETRSVLAKAYKNYCSNKNTLEQDATMIPLCKGRFLSFPRIEFDMYSRGDRPKIRATKKARENAKPIVDQASLICRLDENAASEALSNRQKKYNESIQKKRSRHEIIDLQDSSTPEIASAPTKRRKGGDLDDLEANTSNNLHQSQDTNDLMEHRRLLAQLEVYRKQKVAHLQRKKLVEELEEKVRELESDKKRDEEVIHILRNEMVQLNDTNKQQFQESMRWKSEADRLRQQLRTPPASPYASRNTPLTPTSDRSTSTELDRLKREIKIYKSRSEFYKKETASKKSQIDTLMEEKSRFMKRIEELEDAQLCFAAGDDAHGDDLQF